MTTNPAALDEQLALLKDYADGGSVLGLDLHWIHDQLCRYSAIVKAVEGGEKALVLVDCTKAMHIAGHDAYEIAETEYPERGTPISCAWDAMLAASGIDALIKGD